MKGLSGLLVLGAQPTAASIAWLWSQWWWRGSARLALLTWQPESHEGGRQGTWYIILRPHLNNLLTSKRSFSWSSHTSPESASSGDQAFSTWVCMSISCLKHSSTLTAAAGFLASSSFLDSCSIWKVSKLVPRLDALTALSTVFSEGVSGSFAVFLYCLHLLPCFTGAAVTGGRPHKAWTIYLNKLVIVNHTVECCWAEIGWKLPTSTWMAATMRVVPTQ